MNLPRSDDSEFKSNTLLISNLLIGTSESDLVALFTRFGQIDRIATFPSRCFADVEYRRVEEAVVAKETLQGTDLNGNRIKIDYALPAKPCNSLWVGGISPSVSDHELKARFKKFGKLKEFRILRHSNKTALIDYFDINNAIQAMNMMNGKQMCGSFLRVDFLWSPLEPRKVPCPSSIDGSSSASKQYPHSFGEDHPSKVLKISYPPSVQMDEQMILNSMTRYGEILRCNSYPSRHFSLVEFQTVEQARRAMEEQNGMLFNDPRFPIVYSNDGHVSHFQGSLGRHSGPEFSHVVGNEGSWRNPSPALSTSIRPNHGNEGSWRKPSLALSSSLPIRPNYGNEGSWRKPSLALSSSLPIRPNYGNEGSWIRPSPALSTNHGSCWEGYDPAQLDRESKRIRRDGSVTNLEFMWRGIITKSGTHVCHARCIPIGKGIESELPEIINCSARTDLDILARHYTETAIDVEIGFFIPDRDEDLVSYNEFINYLELKNQASVAKLDDGTNLFLVPPSDFLPDMVKVSGPRRLYGVVLKFLPAAASYRQESQSITQAYVDQSLFDYNRGMQEESLLASSSKHVVVPNSAMPQSESHQSLGLSNEAPSQAWNPDQSTVSDPSSLSFSNQYNSVWQQSHPPPRHYTPSYSGGLVQGGTQYQAPFIGMPQQVPLPSSAMYSQGSHEAVYHQPEIPMLNQNYIAVSGAVNQTHNASPSQEQQELQSMLPRADQATLQFAANILQQIKQLQQPPPNSPTGQGPQD